MTASMKRFRAALHMPANAEAFVLYARFIVMKMTGNPWFSQPVPSLAKVLAAATALHVAQVDALTRTKGLATKRTEARGALVNVLMQLKAYVEGVANDNPESAVSIIESAGMDPVLPRYPDVGSFTARPGRVSRTVDLKVKAGPKGCTYYWQQSTDGGKTWIDLPPTKQAKTTVRDLEPGKTYWFRHAILGRRGLGDWSDKISVVVQ